MISPEELTTILERIDNWSEVELKDNIEEIVPILTSSLKGVEQKSLSLRSIHILLDRCLPCISITVVEREVLQHTLPVAKEIFTEALEHVETALQGTDEDDMELTVHSLLQVCCRLLNDLDKVLQFVSSKCPLQASVVASLPSTILQILLTAFNHCHDSEELYGNLYSYICDLFENCGTLLTTLHPLLARGILFSCKCEKEQSILQNVLELLADVAKATTMLGISVQTVAWKTYVYMVENHASSQDLWKVIDISLPVEMLATTCASILSLTLNVSMPDNVLLLKVMVVASFLIRVLTRLCCIFTGHLTDSCMSALLHLLAVLHRHCLPSAKYQQKTDTSLIKEGQRRVGVGISTLITCLLSDRCFIQAFFLRNGKSESPLTSLLFCTSVASSLVTQEIDVRKPWMSDPDDNLLAVIFQALGSCHAELCGELQFQGISQPGKPPRSTDLYEYILVPVAALALRTPPSDFGIIERLLLKNIMELDPWRAVFSMDLWCMIARQGPASVRLSHTKLVLQLIDKQQLITCNPAVVYLQILFSRLWPLLLPQHQQFLLSEYSPKHMPHMWREVSINQILETGIPTDIISETNQNVSDFLSHSQSLDTFKKMICSLEASRVVLSNENTTSVCGQVVTDLAASVTRLWSCVSSSLFDLANTSWLDNFLEILHSTTIKLTPILSGRQFLQIFKPLCTITHASVCHLKLFLLSILKALAEKVLDPSDPTQNNIFSDVGELFSMILQDKNLLIQQEALEVFEYFAHVTSHEQIIRITMSKSKEIQHQLSSYFKKEPAEIRFQTRGVQYINYLQDQEKIQCAVICEKDNERDLKTMESVIAMHKSGHLKLKENSSCEFQILNFQEKNVSLNNILQKFHEIAEVVRNLKNNENLSVQEKHQMSIQINAVRKILDDLYVALHL